MSNKPKLPDRPETPMPSPELIARLAEEYKAAKEFADKTASRADELKRELVRQVSSNGKQDDRGHKWMPAGDMQLKHERRVSTSFDLSAAIEWIKNMDAWDEVKEVIETTNEDRILQYAWANEYKDVVAKFYTERETWAFKLVNEKSYDEE